MATEERLAALCRRIRASDRDAFAEVFLELRPGLLRFVDSRVHEPATAHDLVQDIFVALWERRHTLDPGQSIKALLFRMARNRAYNHVRARGVRQRHAATVDQVVATNGAPDLDAADLAARLRDWIAALPERQREAIELTRFGGLSHREAAEIMDISPRTLNNHLVRALARLNERLAAHESALPRGTP